MASFFSRLYYKAIFQVNFMEAIHFLVDPYYLLSTTIDIASSNMCTLTTLHHINVAVLLLSEQCHCVMNVVSVVRSFVLSLLTGPLDSSASCSL